MTTTEVPAGLGAGWRQLVDELATEVAERDDAARVVAGLTPEGLLDLRIRSAVIDKSERRRLERDYAARANDVCETCGRPGKTRAGAVLQVLCGDCS